MWLLIRAAKYTTALETIVPKERNNKEENDLA